jgi:hypothetical protein
MVGEKGGWAFALLTSENSNTPTASAYGPLRLNSAAPAAVHDANRPSYHQAVLSGLLEGLSALANWLLESRPLDSRLPRVTIYCSCEYAIKSIIDMSFNGPKNTFAIGLGRKIARAINYFLTSIGSIRLHTSTVILQNLHGFSNNKLIQMSEAGINNRHINGQVCRDLSGEHSLPDYIDATSKKLIAAPEGIFSDATHTRIFQENRDETVPVSPDILGT